MYSAMCTLIAVSRVSLRGVVENAIAHETFQRIIAPKRFNMFEMCHTNPHTTSVRHLPGPKRTVNRTPGGSDRTAAIVS